MGAALVPLLIGAGGALAISAATKDKPKVVTAPEVPPPPSIPEVGEEVGDTARRQRLRGGRAKTTITGELEPTVTGKKRLLG